MADHLPQIKPCKQGRYKLSCICGWRPAQRFTSPAGAEAFWARHARKEIL